MVLEFQLRVEDRCIQLRLPVEAIAYSFPVRRGLRHFISSSCLPVGVAVASPSSPLRSCWSVRVLANCSIGSLKLHTQPSIIASSHVFFFDSAAQSEQSGSCLTIRRLDESSPFFDMDSTAVKIQALGDLELAVLLCLTAQQHCIISAQNLLLDTLAQELQSVRLYSR